MARSQFTFTFRNAEPGAQVTFSAAVYASKTAQAAVGPTLVLDNSLTVAVWSDATELTATWVDGTGASIAAEASLAIPVVVETGGTLGTGPDQSDAASIAAKAQKITRTAVKTGNYTAAVGDMVPCDTTSAAFTVTLPNAPAVGSRVVVKIVTLGAGHFVTIACGGSDVFNKSAGGTTATLQLLGHAMNLQYDTGGIWTVVADDVPLTALNGSFLSYAATPTSDLTAFGVYLPEAHGAVGDGTTDDTTAVQAAFTACPNGGRVYLSKLYKVTAPISVTTQCSIEGTVPLGNDPASGTGLVVRSGLTTASSTTGVLAIGANGCRLSNFAALCTAATPSAGSGISFTAGRFARMDNVTTLGFWNNVEFSDGFYWRMRDCDVLSPTNYGVYIHNTSPSSDWGDMTIAGCVFTIEDRTANAAAAVRWESGGGLRFENNKINGGLQTDASTSAGKFGTGVYCAMPDGMSTSVLLINGNSIENCANSGVQVTQQGTTGVLGKINITGNEFLGPNTAVGIVMRIPTAQAGMGTVVISDNIFTGLAGSMSLGNLNTVIVGPNVHKNVTTYAVNIFTSMVITDLLVDPQVLSGSALSLYLENTATVTQSTGPFSQAAWRLERELGAISSNSAWTNLWQLVVPDFGAGKISLTVFGNLSGVGAAVYTVDAVYTKGSGGSVTVAAGTATTAGGVFDVQFDTATTAGSIYLAVKRNTTNGTSLSGRISAVVTGAASQIKKS